MLSNQFKILKQNQIVKLPWMLLTRALSAVQVMWGELKQEKVQVTFTVWDLDQQVYRVSKFQLVVCQKICNAFGVWENICEV